VAQRVYATLADFEDFTDGAHEAESVDVINAKLRRASIVIDGLTRNSRYDLDEDGYPTDADISEAFKDATCAQMAWWDSTDDVTGAESQKGSISIGSVSIGASGRTSGGVATSTPGSSRIAPEAIDILTSAGLISGIVSHT
jgi:hypothetical protein